MSHHKAFARKLRQLSNLRKKIVRTTSFSLRQKLLQRYEALLRFLMHHISYGKLLRYLVIPGLFVMQEVTEATAQNFLAPDSSIIKDSTTALARPVTADLDGDGDLDIFYGDYETEGLRYIVNMSSASGLQFAESVVSPLLPEESLSYGYFSVGDLDDDGDLDVLLFVGSYDDGTQIVLSTFENTGTIDSPEFIPGDTPIILQGSGILLPNLIDLDADGDLDLLGTLSGATNDLESTVSIVYYENEGGVFGPDQMQASLNLTAAAGTVIGDLTVGDLDGDGDFDVLAYLAGNDLDTQQYFLNYFYHENTGSATEPSFADPVTSPFGLSKQSSSVGFDFPHLVDLDNDGDLDILAFRYDPNTEVGHFVFYENSDSVMTAVRNVDLPELMTYPNPVNDLLHIESEFIIEHVILFNTSGKKIKEYTNPLASLQSYSYLTYRPAAILVSSKARMKGRGYVSLNRSGRPSGQGQSARLVFIWIVTQYSRMN